MILVSTKPEGECKMKYRVCKTSFNSKQCQFNSHFKQMPPDSVERTFSYGVMSPAIIGRLASGDLLLEETDDTNHSFITRKILSIDEVMQFFKTNIDLIKNISSYPAQNSIAEAICKCLQS